ncbi:tRNA adenosine(34) deaminase TadA [candidate division KSB1 bacterium]|nr:tRNA adenosine(34) deaminase TadA [candidate division KSB1 bacterium]
MEQHEKWMTQALIEAEKAYQVGEVPVGAIVVIEDRIVGRGHNLVEHLQDPTAHAEMMAITAAANTLGTWRVEGARLYVTLEPCPMCAGAVIQARIPQVIFGAWDPRLGACGSVLNLFNFPAFPVQVTALGGIMKAPCLNLIQDFFKARRREQLVKENT